MVKRWRIQNGCPFPAIQKAEILEAATRNEIVRAFADYNAESRFIPYIEMHEFEALLFSNADILADQQALYGELKHEAELRRRGVEGFTERLVEPDAKACVKALTIRFLQADSLKREALAHGAYGTLGGPERGLCRRALGSIKPYG